MIVKAKHHYIGGQWICLQCVVYNIRLLPDRAYLEYLNDYASKIRL
jgi:hypothetical protein